MDVNAKCVTCAYWLPKNKDTAFGTLSGECRQDSPKISHASREAIWPVSKDADWCGQWSLKA